MLGLEWYLNIVITLKGFGEDIRTRFILLDLMSFKLMWKLLAVGDLNIKLVGPTSFSF